MSDSTIKDIRNAALYVGCIAIVFRILVMVLIWTMGTGGEFRPFNGSDVAGNIALFLIAMVIPAFCITPSKNRAVYGGILAVLVMGMLLVIWKLHREIFIEQSIDYTSIVDPDQSYMGFMISIAYYLIPFVICCVIGWRLNRKPLFLLIWAGLLILCDIIFGSSGVLGKYLLILTLSYFILIISAAISLYVQKQSKNSKGALTPPEDY